MPSWLNSATATASAAMGLLTAYNYAKTTSTYTGGYMVFSDTDITAGDFIAISGPATLTFNLDLSGAFSHSGYGWDEPERDPDEQLRPQLL